MARVWLPPRVCRFVPAAGDDGYGYWRELRPWWRSIRPIVNVEHDMEYGPSLVAALAACPYPLCTYAYQLRDHAGWAQSTNRPRVEVGCVAEGDEWADFSGIGFCKIAPQARVGPLERAYWRDVEKSVNAAVRGPWHVHWPAVEHHWRSSETTHA